MNTIKKMVNMKEKVIFYGWLCSIPCMMAGLGTIEWVIETGEWSVLSGLLLFASFIFLVGYYAGIRKRWKRKWRILTDVLMPLFVNCPAV